MSEGKLKRYAPFLVILILTISLLYTIITIVDLNDKLYMRKSDPWLHEQLTVEPNHEIDFTITPPYAGYLIVNLNSRGANVTFHVRYTAYGINHDFGTNGYSVIPVLPVSVKMTLTNLDAINSASADLNVTYVY